VERSPWLLRQPGASAGLGPPDWIRFLLSNIQRPIFDGDS
jgi:hypothetical protein